MMTLTLARTIRVAAGTLGFTVALAVAGCGGGGGSGGSLDGPAAPAGPTQQAKQQAALQRAHAMNADTLGQVKAERNARRAPTR